MRSRIWLLPLFILIGIYVYYLFYPVPFESQKLDPTCLGDFPVNDGCSSYCLGFPDVMCESDKQCVTTCTGQCYGFAKSTCDPDMRSKPYFWQFLDGIIP